MLSVLYGVGLVIGVAVALVISLILRFLTGPLIEALRELGESAEPEPFIPAPLPGPHAVLVSDLHVDTWPLGGTYVDHTSEFEEFIRVVTKDASVKSVYFGGDFADIPLHPMFYFQPPMLPAGELITVEASVLQGQEKLLQHLQEIFRSAQRVVGITGNHDLGINGVRFVRGEHAFWNPSVLVSAHPGKSLNKHLYMEHGHRFDPLNWLYLRYAVMDLTRRGYDQGPPPTPPPTERRLRQMVERRTGPEHQSGIPVRQGMSGGPARDSAGAWLVRLRYRGEARKALRRLRRLYGDSVTTFVCGHTHLPDRYRFKDGTLYVNLGDWSGDTRHKTYSVLDGNGDLHGPYTWTGKPHW